jgi:hypothetical protein
MTPKHPPSARLWLLTCGEISLHVEAPDADAARLFGVIELRNRHARWWTLGKVMVEPLPTLQVECKCGYHQIPADTPKPRRCPDCQQIFNDADRKPKPRGMGALVAAAPELVAAAQMVIDTYGAGRELNPKEIKRLKEAIAKGWKDNDRRDREVES